MTQTRHPSPVRRGLLAALLTAAFGAVPAFAQSGTPIRLPVRLRYRVLERKTFWTIAPYRADKVLLDTVKAVAERMADATKLPLFYGHPEK